MIHNTNIDKNYKAKIGRQLVPLDIDKETDKRKYKRSKSLLTGKQFEKTRRKFERILNKVHGK